MSVERLLVMKMRVDVVRPCLKQEPQPGIGALAIAREHQLWKIIPPPTSDYPYNSNLYEPTKRVRIVSGHLIASYYSQDFSSTLWRLRWEFKGTLAMRLSR